MPKTFKFPQSSEWWTILQHKMDTNKQAVAQSINNHSISMNFYCAFNVVSVMILNCNNQMSLHGKLRALRINKFILLALDTLHNCGKSVSKRHPSARINGFMNDT